MEDGLFQFNDPEGNPIAIFYMSEGWDLTGEQLKRINELYFEHTEELDIFEDVMQSELGLRRVYVDEVNITRP